MTPPNPVALWLVPASPWHERFGALIGELSGQFDGVVFEPHITLHVGTLPDAFQVSGRLAAVTASRPPLTLVCGNTTHDSDHFRTLFVQFHDTRVNDLRDALLNAIELRGSYDLRPHLSLLYRGGLDVGERERLAAMHRFEGEGVAFDEVVLVRPAISSSDLFDIRGLDTRQRHTLTAVAAKSGRPT